MKNGIINNEENNFLYNVAWLRKSFRLSKKEMSEIMGISITSLDKIENGIMPPRLKMNSVIAIYRRFGFNPSAQFARRLGERKKLPLE